ncbi:VCBS domain-containing protein [Stenotrophomonas panacihumi]|uniref:VCBS domain-containing protein n=1 Tax=Stenotrophomonas panacihumi TaxID=676599 RepID=UPI000A79DB31|nr:VCBS domain-containing protein [Stenotrophomonas panacihumi]
MDRTSATWHVLPRLHALALEPRLMFDGAAAAATDSQHHANANNAGHREATDARAESAVRPATQADAMPASATPSATRELLVIDSRLQGAELLAAAAAPDARVLMIHPGEDGLQAITQALSELGQVDSIQILSHGAPGSFQLGSRSIGADDASLAQAVGSWKGALAADADILLYGCRIGEGVEGQRLVQNLANWTGADVAASDDDTGAATAGGDWTLETHAGTIEHALAIDAGVLSHYASLLADAAPTVTLAGGGDVLIGDQFTFTATFTNPSSQEGYAPYIDLFLPATGRDGDDGATFVSATYLGQAVNAYVVTFDANGQATHPLQRDATGQAVVINAATYGMRAGDQLVVLQLPYASVGADQPAIAVQITAHVSNLADTAASNGSPDLGIVARGGFQYGNDSLNNPTNDPSLVQVGTSGIQVHPTVITLAQTVDAPEGKTATGENYGRELTVTATPAPGQTITNLVLEQDLPPEILVTGITPPAGGEVTQLVLADGRVVTGPSEIRILLAAGAYVAHYTVEVPSLSAPASVVVDFYVPQPDASGNAILDPNTGAPVTIDIAAATAGAEWVPLDPRDVGPDGTIDLSGTGQPTSFVAESIALYKQAQYSSDVGYPGPTPGDAFNYTLTLNLSDYYLFGISQIGQGNFVILDAVGDGQVLAGTPTMRVSLNGVDYTIALVTLTTNNPDGSTSVTFDVGLSLRNLFGNPGQLGGDIQDDGILQGATVVIINYTTIIAQAYTTPYPQSEINEGDTIGNDATLQASVLLDRINTSGYVATDHDAVSGSVPVSHVDMAVVAVNGGTVPANGELRPGDTVTFRLGYDLVTGDYENLVLTGYLPLPLFNVSGISWAQGNGSGEWNFGAGNSNGDPTVSVRSGAGNSVIFDFGNWAVNATSGSRIELVFTLTVGDQPFADLRQLTVLATSDQTTTIDQTHLQSAAAATIQSIAEPSLLVYHGVVSSTQGTITGTLGSWNAPGSTGAPFSGSVTDPLAVNGDIRGIDAGDRLRLATALENIGGGSAYDVSTDITLPAGVQFVGGSLASANLLVYRGDGTQMVLGVDFTVNGNTIEFIDHGGTGALAAGRPGSAADASGANLVVVTYDVVVSDIVAASATMQSAATLTRYASVEGGANFTQGNTEHALQQVAAPTIVVNYAGGSLDNGDSTAAHTQGNALAIGEAMTYDIVVTLPEGSTQSLRIQDLIPDGLRLDMSFGNGAGYQLITLASGSGALAADFNGTLVVFAANGIGGTIGDNGVDGQLVFSRADTGADNIANNNSFVIRVRLVADNNTGNQDGRNLVNSAQLTYSDPDGDTPNGTVALDRTVDRSGGTPNVIVREPTLVITQVTDQLPPLGVDEAVPVTFQITIRNNGVSSDYNAFDLGFSDTLPTQMDGYSILGVTFSGGASASSGTPFIIENGVLRIANGVKIDVPAGGSIIIRVNGTVNDTAAGLPSFPNTATVSWSSLDGAVAGERTGVDGLLNSGVLNDYRAAATINVPVLQGMYISRVGGMTDTAPADPTYGDYEDVAIGEVVRYRVVGAFAQGVTGSIELRITLAPGLGVVNDGTLRIGLIANGNGLSSDLNLVTGGALYITGNEDSDQAQPLQADLGGAQLTGILDMSRVSFTTDGNGNTVLVISLGTVTNADLDADFELFAIEFNARVLNVAANTAGAALAVSAKEYSAGTQVSLSGTVYERINEPAFSNLDKRVYDFNPALTATTGRASVDIGFLQSGNQPAYDVVLTDAFPGGSNYTFTGLTIDGVTYAPGNLPAGVSVDTSNGVTVRFDQLDPGTRVSVRYDVTVPNQGAVANSNATLTWTSLPDDFTSWGGSPVGGAGTSSGERTGSGGSPNTYILTEGAGLGVISGTLWNDTFSATGSAVPDGPGLANQEVTLYWAGVDNVLGTVDDKAFIATTDANGRFQFGVLPSGVYRVDAPTIPLVYPQPVGELHIRIDSDTSTPIGQVAITLGEGATGQANAGYVHQNVAPVNQVPGRQTGLEDVLLALPGISVSDIDAGSGSLDVLLTVAHGTLSLSGTPGGVTVTGSGTASLRLTGSITDLNAALAMLQYLGNQDYNGNDTLTITTSDQGNFGDADANGTPGQPSDALIDVDTVAIVLDPVNDAPIGVDDVFVAVEAGGDGNTTPGVDPAGDMLANDIDVDIATNGDSLSVTQLRNQNTGNTAGPLPGNARTALVGQYGTLYFYGDGAFEYVVDNTNADVEALRTSSQRLFETFLYDAVDTGGLGTSAVLTIAIHGANDAPVGVNDRGDAVEKGGVTNGSGGSDATGNVLDNDTDVDSVFNGETRAAAYVRLGVETGSGAFTAIAAGTNSTNGAVINGIYGTLTLGADGSYRYVVNDNDAVVQALMAGQELIEHFTYAVRDTDGLLDLAQLDIHVAGANDNPVASDDVADAQAGSTDDDTQESNPSGNVILQVSRPGDPLDDGHDYDVDGGDQPNTLLRVIGAGQGGDVAGLLIDVDQASGVETTIVGLYGTLYISADGSARYNVNSNNPDVLALSAGQTLQDVFTYEITDTAGLTDRANITITVHGADDPPVAQDVIDVAQEAGGVANGTPGENPTGDALLNSFDPDGDPIFVVDIRTGLDPAGGTQGIVGQRLRGEYGWLTIQDNGDYLYEVDNDDPRVEALRTPASNLQDVFTFTIGDGTSRFDSATIRIVIQGQNDNPVANPDTADATEAGGINNTTAGVDPTGNVLLNDTDVDANDIRNVIGVSTSGGTAGTVGAALTGTYGSLVLNADGQYVYRVDNTLAAVQALRTYADTLTETFNYEITDRNGARSTATLAITVHGQNDFPVLVADTATAVEAGGVANGTPGTDPAGNVLANDTDVDAGDTLVVRGVQFGSTQVLAGQSLAGSYGTLTVNADGSYTYVVDNNNATVQALRTSANTLVEVFTYQASDLAGATRNTTLTITIQGANDNPVANDDLAFAVEKGGVNNGDNGVAPGGNLLTNDRDVDANDTRTLDGIRTGNEAAGGAFTAVGGSVVVSGTYGDLTVNPDGTYTYVLRDGDANVQALLPGQVVTEQFTYRIHDLAGAQDAATLTITILGANDAPTASSFQETAVEAGGVDNASPGLDPAGSLLAHLGDVDDGAAALVVTAFGNGAVDGTVGQRLQGLYGELLLNADGTYQYFVDNDNPDVEALRTNGDRLFDGFTYTVTDPHGASASAVILVVIHGQNDTPVASDDFADAFEAGGDDNRTPGVNPTGNVLLNDSDVDAPGYGETATVTAVRTGAESGSGTAGTVGVELRGLYGWLTLNADGSARYRLDNDMAAVQALRGPADTLEEFFTYTHADASGATDEATITVVIHGANDAPVPDDDAATAVEAGGVDNATPGVDPTGNVLDNDTDVDGPQYGEQLSVVSYRSGVATTLAGNVLAGRYGQLVINADGTFRYSVDNLNAAVQALRGPGDQLSESFVYQMRDAAGLVRSATLVVTIEGRNDTPKDADDALVAVEAGGDANATPGVDPSANVFDNDVDVDGPQYGETATVTAVRTGAENEAGTAGSVGMELRGLYGWLTINADGSTHYRLDNDMAEVQALRGPDDTLLDRFTYTHADTDGATDQATITVLIRGANDAPVPLDDAATAIEAGGVANTTPGVDPAGNVLDNDSDPDGAQYGEQLQVVGYQGAGGSVATGGTLAGLYGQLVIDADGHYRYVVDNGNPLVEALRTPDQQLVERFTYQVRDAGGLVRSATLTLTLQGANDNPVARDDQDVAIDQLPAPQATGNVLPNDSDVDGGDALSVIAVRPGADGADVAAGQALAGRYGTLVLQADGSYRYDIDMNNPEVLAAAGLGRVLSDAFTYTITDLAGATSQAVLTIQLDIAAPYIPPGGNEDYFSRYDEARPSIGTLPDVQPAVFVGPTVERLALERSLAGDIDPASGWRIDPERYRASSSIAAGLGGVGGQFVARAVAESRVASAIDLARFNEREGRASLSADGLLPTPGLQALTPHGLLHGDFAPRTSEPAARGFSRQLRGAADERRLPTP